MALKLGDLERLLSLLEGEYDRASQRLKAERLKQDACHTRLEDANSRLQVQVRDSPSSTDLKAAALWAASSDQIRSSALAEIEVSNKRLRTIMAEANRAKARVESAKKKLKNQRKQAARIAALKQERDNWRPG